MGDAPTPPFDLETVDRLLSTTRAVRRRLDPSRPVPRELLLECIALSQQAPTGSNTQRWRWVVVTNPELRRGIAAIYRRGIGGLQERAEASEGQNRRVYESAVWLAEHLAEVPAHVLACIEGRPPETFTPVAHGTVYGSILPAVWSFQLALRSRGLGSCFTSMHLIWEQEVADLLGIPDDVLQVALLPVAYTVGTEFRPAARPAPETITSFDGWSFTKSQ